MDGEGLRAAIRERLERGELSQETCLVTWFGRGAGQSCAACGGTTASTRSSASASTPGGGVLRFHHRCFAIREEERDREGLVNR